MGSHHLYFFLLKLDDASEICVCVTTPNCTNIIMLFVYIIEMVSLLICTLYGWFFPKLNIYECLTTHDQKAIYFTAAILLVILAVDMMVQLIEAFQVNHIWWRWWITAYTSHCVSYNIVDVLTPQRALGPDYDWQPVRLYHFISQSTPISWLG